MTLPKVSVRKIDFQTGVRPGAVDRVAVIAASSIGSQNVPATLTNRSQALTEFGYGPLTEAADYLFGSGKPVVCVRPVASTAATYSAISNPGGTATPAAGGTTPFDAFDVRITFLNAVVLGTTGGQYTYSLDGGVTTSAIQALGTSLNVVIPNTGITIVLGTSSQTIDAGGVVSFTTTAPEPTSSDLTATFEALRETSQEFEGVLIEATATAAYVTALDTFLANMEANDGKYRYGILTVRRKTAIETEAEYTTALADIRAASTASTRVHVCADGGDLVSGIRGVSLFRSTGLALAGRLAQIDIGTEPSFVGDGPLRGFTIKDSRGNPKYWDEALSPTLNTLKYVTLRSHNKKTGAFINNGLVFSPENSDVVFSPHLRCMNRASELVHDMLTDFLNAGVLKENKPGPNGARYIRESSALQIEGRINGALGVELGTKVDEVKFSLKRDDDISSNQGARLGGTIELVAQSYIIEFDIGVRYAKVIGA